MFCGSSPDQPVKVLKLLLQLSSLPSESIVAIDSPLASRIAGISNGLLFGRFMSAIFRQGHTRAGFFSITLAP
jgi:hypothetical protein